MAYLTVDSILEKRPTMWQWVVYYWIALTNNAKHKMDYMKFKSRLHRTEVIVDFFTHDVKKAEYKDDRGYEITHDQVIEDVITRTEWMIENYTRLLWFSRAPFQPYLVRYVDVRDDLLDMMNPVNPHRKMPNNRMKHAVYIVQELIIMSEFIKNDIDRNDDLPFKVWMFVLNGIIILGQYVWERYGVDDF